MRNESENRIYQLLLRFGVKPNDITEPDKVIGFIRKEPDFIFDQVAVEVKEITPSKEEFKEITELKNKLLMGEFVGYTTPVPKRQFSNHIDDAAQNFKNYPEFLTILIEDLTIWYPNRPAADTLLFGHEALHINVDSEVTGRSWRNRVVQSNLRRSIGTYIFYREFDVMIYHNLHAYEHRKLPKLFMENLSCSEFDQYFFTMMIKTRLRLCF